MAHVRTVSISLEDRFIRILDRMAVPAGSRSEAIRRLLEASARRDFLRQVEESYAAYYADPSRAEESRRLTEEMLSITQFPDEWYKDKGGLHGKRTRSKGRDISRRTR